ncbi:hypothetical protein MF672_000945 [Actinomadura sp. ATCC 31491]|uniref:Uncharacterized protein n=1 Tax=Actinomadura luzonensis TaxID=2805427 RepID=A0ABT0FJ96_9ACTN|nr:hypothetical protein [Actinomadura luzonensis]MCK2212372.1 hypothetical protein [Actinomadura luzonensis]
MDVMEQAAALKGQLIDFALSPRFARELNEAFEQSDPEGLADGEAAVSMIIDHFVLQRRLASGDTVIDRFLRAHPRLSPQEREMILGWRDVVEGIFEVQGKDQDAVILFNLIDELTYRARSNMGKSAFRPAKKGMFLICRLVPLDEDWLVSANISLFPADARDQLLTQAAEFGLRNPKLVFRNPDKLTTTRRILTEQRDVFIDLYGAEYIVVRGEDVAPRYDAFLRACMDRAQPGNSSPLPGFTLPDDILDAETVAIHFDPETGISFYLEFGLLQELFADPKLINRRRYRETLTSYLRGDDISPAAIKLLTEPGPDNAGVVFGKLLKKKDFSWPEHGESLLRRYKARYFDEPQLPTTVPAGDTMAGHLRNAQREESPEP